MFTCDSKWNQPKTELKRTVKEILFTLLLTVAEMKWNFVLQNVRKKKAHSAKTILDEINACADVSFRMISLWLVFTWQVLLEMEFHFCQNDRREITTIVTLILSLIRNWAVTEMKIFDFTRNENSCKHAPIYNSFSWLMVFIMGIWRLYCPRHLQLFLFLEFNC